MVFNRLVSQGCFVAAATLKNEKLTAAPNVKGWACKYTMIHLELSS